MKKLQKSSFLACMLLLTVVYASFCQKTRVEIKGKEFWINGKPTYEGRYWKQKKIQGLLLNSRMVQGVFDDLNPETVDNFKYLDTGKWDAERNNLEFVEAMPSWKAHGLNAFTLNMQGGSPIGYGNWDFQNPGFHADGSLNTDYMKRLERILLKADELEMVVILGLFYFGQDQRLLDEQAIKNAVSNTINWLHDKGFKNVMIEINNETQRDLKNYDHEILLADRVHELIDLVKSIERDGFSYYVSTSFPAMIVPTKEVIEKADFVLFHANALREYDKYVAHIAAVKAVVGEKEMPIVSNEDDNHDFENPKAHFYTALDNYISWGFFDYRKKEDPDMRNGFQTIPVDWTISSPAKKAFFELVKEITGN